MQIEVDTCDSVGKALADQAVYDIVTTEVLWRLTAAGDLNIDAGANIGYMTSILARRAGQAGQVIAFEPHPETFGLLEKNVVRWRENPDCPRITLHQAAVNNVQGTATLDIPANGEHNPSQAYLSSGTSSSGVVVQTVRLEQFIPEDRQVGVLKMDLQSHEAAALEGLGEQLSRGTIRDLVYEEESGYPAKSHSLLEDAGYEILWFEEHLSGFWVVPPTYAVRKRSYDILPSFLATRDSARARKLLGTLGWHSLNRFVTRGPDPALKELQNRGSAE